MKKYRVYTTGSEPGGMRSIRSYEGWEEGYQNCGTINDDEMIINLYCISTSGSPAFCGSHRWMVINKPFYGFNHGECPSPEYLSTLPKEAIEALMEYNYYQNIFRDWTEEKSQKMRDFIPGKGTEEIEKYFKSILYNHVIPEMS